MSTLRFLAALFSCSLAALGSSVGPENSFTDSHLQATQTVNNPVTVTLNLFSTQLIAKGPGGQVVFDQTLFSAYADPSVQALVTQASLALNGIGATSILGPSLISSSVVLEGSSVVNTETARSTDQFLPFTIVTFGPEAIAIGERQCRSSVVTAPVPSENSASSLISVCTGGTPYFVGDDEVNLNTFRRTLTTIFQDVSTTETFRTTEVYLLQAQDSSSPSAIPEPGTLGMLIVCLPVLAALRSRRSK